MKAGSRGLLHDYEPSCGPSFEALVTGDPDNPDYEYECKETAECANLEKCSKGDAANGTESQCGCKELTCERECDTAEG